jgi:ApeA N-terminal domain 1
MMMGFEHTGFWWDPRDPDTRWPGTLTFDPVAGATLKRSIAFHASQIFGESKEFPVIYGEGTGGMAITLIDCFETSSTGIFANAVVTGFHAGEPDPPILVAAATIENLGEWWRPAAIVHDSGLDYPDVGVRYTQPDAAEIHDDGAMCTTIRSGALSSFERRKVSIAEEIRIEMKASSPQPLSAFRQRMHACQDLLSIASLTLCNVEDFRLYPPSANGRPKVVGHFHAVPVFKNPAEGWPRYLFRHKDVEARMKDVFTAWLSNAESLSVVRSLYMSGAYGKSFIELRLLALAQAAEAYHRRLYEGHDLYRDADDYAANVLPGLLAAIPSGLDQSHRDALRSRLKYGNEFSLTKRMTMLFDKHQAALAAVIPSPRSWIKRIVDYRNGFTHHPVVEDRTDIDKMELVRCNYVLRILLELCFLESMSMDAVTIETLAKGCERYRQIGRRFFATTATG